MNSNLSSPEKFESIVGQTGYVETNPALHVSGDHSTRIEALFREEHPKLVHFLVARTGSWAEARDVAAQAFIQILGIKDPEAVNSLKAYLYTVARNIAINRQKLAAIRRRIDGIARHEFANTAPSPEPQVFALERLQVLQRAIKRLRPLWREALMLRFWDHLPFDEIVVRFAERGVQVEKRTVERWVHDAIAECRGVIWAAEGNGSGKLCGARAKRPRCARLVLGNQSREGLDDGTAPPPG